MGNNWLFVSAGVCLVFCAALAVLYWWLRKQQHAQLWAVMAFTVTLLAGLAAIIQVAVA